MSKTKIGAVLIAAGELLEAHQEWSAWGTALKAFGIAIGGIGLRDALGKTRLPR